MDFDGERTATQLAATGRFRGVRRHHGPAARQGFVLELINLLLIGGHQAGLEGGKPVIAQPSKGHRAQGAARQLGQRVMRHGLAPIQEERDLIP